MNIRINIPELNIKEEDAKLLLVIKLFEEKIISLGRAAELTGYSEKAFSEILLNKGISPIQYLDTDLNEELKNT
jgi:predicted HTH domain antitoxin